jgi:hypothetical protein
MIFDIVFPLTATFKHLDSKLRQIWMEPCCNHLATFHYDKNIEVCDPFITSLGHASGQLLGEKVTCIWLFLMRIFCFNLCGIDGDRLWTRAPVHHSWSYVGIVIQAMVL